MFFHIFSFPFHLDVVIFNEIIMVNFLLLLSLSLATKSHAVAAGRIYYYKQNGKTQNAHPTLPTLQPLRGSKPQTQKVKHANDEKTNHAMCVEDVNK